MKFIFCLCAAFSYLVSLQAQEIAYPEREVPTSAFELTIEQIPQVRGEVRIAVFDSRAKYNQKKDPVHAVVLPVDGNSITWSDDSLPHGNYAIAVYHDENTNGELDTNLLGIPNEAYGFSNNARGKFGPASWEDASIRVDRDATKINIKLE